jgi:hypothetical protein
LRIIDFISCVLDVATALVATPADIVASVGPAVAAAVEPVVAAALAHTQYNIRMSRRNSRAFAGSAIAPQPLFPLVKTNPGVGPGLPNGPPAPPMGFVAAAAVGASPGNFPANRLWTI